MRAPIVLDFETHAIAGRPAYPPLPVGLAVWDMTLPEDEAFYLSWGHPTANNCQGPQRAIQVLRQAWESGRPLLFHHAKFDLAVAYEQLGLPRLPRDRVHDTNFLAYLYDPHARRLDLKGLAEDLLGEPPEERDALHEWIWAHRVELRATYGLEITSRKGLGAFIAYTPGVLCGDYAIGDVLRTGRLFQALYPVVLQDGMRRAYDRERQLLPILMENEEQGIRVDVDTLGREVELYGAAFDHAEDWLRKTLRASGLNFDADQDVASVLLERGIVREEDFPRTAPTKRHPNGQLSMSKEALMPEMFSDPQIASALGYRNRLATCLKMFMQPWLAQAQARGGIISPSWNQTRGTEKGGTRTGRPSTERPNLLNISKDFEGKSDGYLHPDFLGADFPHLPLCRKYCLPDEDGLWLHRDFSGQEVRIFADHECGDLNRAYNANPQLDPHAWVSGEIAKATGLVLERTRVKNVTFSRLYGGGLGAVERQARCSSREEAKQISDAHDAGLPGRKILVDEITKLARRGIPIRTWGGRLYLPEPPGPDGRSKDYKLINYLCQGGAADFTKQVLIDWHGHPLRRSRFLVTVYDELNISAHRELAVQQMRVLKECMEERRLSVPMLSDAKYGPNWGALIKGEPA
jgi:DNA polymerase I-like protein with 3'-5' exonuclease and polymerase domains